MQIAITGIGIVSALGIGVADNRRNLLSGKSFVKAPKILTTIHKEWPVGEVSISNTDVSRNVLLGGIALKECLADSGLSEEQIQALHLVNGTTVGGMDVIEKHYANWSKGDFSNIACIEQLEADWTSKSLAKQFSLSDSTTISTACSSALNAIIYGASLICTGITKRVVVGGTEALTKFHLNGFASLGIVSEKVCRPFAPDRDGINLGEGAAYLILEEATEAATRDAHIYGYLAGYANSCDAYHQTASSPDGDGAYNAMHNALSISGLTINDINYINAHGTATQNNDECELRAIERLFGKDYKVALESTKNLTGHTTSASGSIEAIFTLWRMEERGYNYALCNAFGFGGNDSSIVLAKQPVSLCGTSSIENLYVSQEYEFDDSLSVNDLISPMQARRMTPSLCKLIAASHKALKQEGLTKPDAIVLCTEWGCIVQTVSLLEQLAEHGEKDFSPTQFMNSTHNAAACTLARVFNCKGLNTTLVDSNDPIAKAEMQAKLLIRSGVIKNALVCAFNETDDKWQSLLNKAGIKSTQLIKSKIIKAK
ncbi:MAG: beta-ketoacyl synthase chain length factor [Paludibacteraceae bacterium]|nr:beta-ketoacyl synthase chain length factor [Paludibacteraceae bacterium]